MTKLAALASLDAWANPSQMIPSITIGPGSAPRLFNGPHREPAGTTKKGQQERIEKAKAKRERKRRQMAWNNIEPYVKK